MRDNLEVRASNSFEPKIKAQKFNYSSSPLSVHQLPQSSQGSQSEMTIQSLQVSDDGQNGVIFIELTEGSFVLKPTLHTPTDVFFHRLASLLEINVPNMRYFSFEDQIYCDIYTAIEEFCNLRHEECLLARLETKLNYFLFELIQYIPSVLLCHIGSERFKKRVVEQGKNLSLIGSCLGFDILVNNHDRFELLWGGSGNISNFLIKVPHFSSEESKDIYNRDNLTVELGEIAFIDNQGNMCDVNNPSIAKNVEHYFKKVANFHGRMLEFIQNLQQNKNQGTTIQFINSSQIKKLKAQFQLFSGYELQCQDIKYIMQGVEEVTKNFMRIWQNKEVNSLYQSTLSELKYTGKSISKSTQQQWANELQTVNMCFCQKMYETLAKVYSNAN